MIPEPPPFSPPALENANHRDLLQLLQKVDPCSPLFRRCRELLDGKIETGPLAPAATAQGEPRFLTIGLAFEGDADCFRRSIEAVLDHHSSLLKDLEFLAVDVNPLNETSAQLKALEASFPNYRYVPYLAAQGASLYDLIVREASGDFVVLLGKDVRLPRGALNSLIDYCTQNPDTCDLLQERPSRSDSHAAPEAAWGPGTPPFELTLDTLSVFAVRKKAWPGIDINRRLIGAGGQDSDLHAEIRDAGGRSGCLPCLDWMRIPGAESRANIIRDGLIVDHEPVDGLEIGRSEESGAENDELVAQTPFHFFDAIYCINLDRQPERWSAMQRRFQKLGIERCVRRFPAAFTPINHHIGCAMSHRRLIAEARRQGFKAVLVFEDDVRFSADAAEVLGQSLRELAGRDWQLLYLGGYDSMIESEQAPGCHHLMIPKRITCTHAIAYHHSVFDAILDAVPENAIDVALWIGRHLAIDQFYTRTLPGLRFLTWPKIAAQEDLLDHETRQFPG
jgi:Glycosyltransferase family 25 (LPS biosynthesis protein)